MRFWAPIKFPNKPNPFFFGLIAEGWAWAWALPGTTGFIILPLTIVADLGRRGHFGIESMGATRQDSCEELVCLWEMTHTNVVKPISFSGVFLFMMKRPKHVFCRSPRYLTKPGSLLRPSTELTCSDDHWVKEVSIAQDSRVYPSSMITLFRLAIDRHICDGLSSFWIGSSAAKNSGFAPGAGINRNSTGSIVLHETPGLFSYQRVETVICIDVYPFPSSRSLSCNRNRIPMRVASSYLDEL